MAWVIMSLESELSLICKLNKPGNVPLEHLAKRHPQDVTKRNLLNWKRFLTLKHKQRMKMELLRNKS